MATDGAVGQIGLARIVGRVSLLVQGGQSDVRILALRMSVGEGGRTPGARRLENARSQRHNAFCLGVGSSWR